MQYLSQLLASMLTSASFALLADPSRSTLQQSDHISALYSAAIFLVSANWNLLTVQILNQVGSGRLGVAAAFSVILVVIVTAAMAIIARLVPGRAGGMAAIQIQEE